MKELRLSEMPMQFNQSLRFTSQKTVLFVVTVLRTRSRKLKLFQGQISLYNRSLNEGRNIKIFIDLYSQAYVGDSY
jgi:hypothetical protein